MAHPSNAVERYSRKLTSIAYTGIGQGDYKPTGDPHWAHLSGFPLWEWQPNNCILLWPMGKWSSLILNIPSNPGPRQHAWPHDALFLFYPLLSFSCLPLTVSPNKKLWRGKKDSEGGKEREDRCPSERCRAEQGPGCIVSAAPRRSIAQLEARRRQKSLVEWSTTKTPEEKQECWEERQLTGRLIDR